MTAQLAITLGPVFLLIVLGQGLYRADFPGQTFWPMVERLNYWLLFPALLVHRLATTDLSAFALGPFTLAITGSTLLTMLLLVVLAPWSGGNRAAFSSVFQGGIRFNTYLILAIASSLLAETGSALAALAIAIQMPVVNIASVIVLQRIHGELYPRRLLRTVISNPLILSCGVGIGLNSSDLGLPTLLEPFLAILGRASLTLGLLAVGAGLGVTGLWGQRQALSIALLIKLIAFPAITLGLSNLLGLASLETTLLVIFTAAPAAPSAYIMARQLGGDATLMANILTLQVLASLLTLPLWLGLVSWVITDGDGAAVLQ